MSPRRSRALSARAALALAVLSASACSHDPEAKQAKGRAAVARVPVASATVTSDTVDSATTGAGAEAAGTPVAAHDSPPPNFVHYPGQGGAIEPWVQEQVELADAAHLRVLVYVGATWCEPCQRFHEAVQRGELNGTLNGLRFLEFDQDRDAPALKAAGYLYQYIPVLALPDPDGKNHGRMISGSVKGPRAVQENLVPRLQALLSGKVVD